MVFCRLECFTKENLAICTDQEILKLSKFLEDGIRESTQRLSRLDTEPCERPNLALRMTCAPHLKSVCQKHAKLFTKEANPLACEVEGPGLLSAEVLRTSQFTVHVRNKNRSLCSSQQDVRVTVKCISTDLTFPADVNEREQNMYLVSYCPENRGMHELSVLVNDEPVQGSPFTVRVSYPPSMLGRSHGRFDNVNSPQSIILSPGGGFLVTEWHGGQILELDKYGRKVGSYGNGVLHHPASIAADTSGHLYVVDVDSAEGQSRVVKIGPNGDVVGVAGGTGESARELSNPRGVALSRQNKLYVCDRDNHRIQVYSANLELLHSIGLRELSGIDQLLTQIVKPNDVAFDNAGNMYVADCANSCILMFSSSGSYLGCFGAAATNGNGLGRLGPPECVHIDSGLVYVTESHNNRVSVFRINGDFVTSFGTQGSKYKQDELKFPVGITIDENGVVYVCEFKDNRIQLF